MKCMKLILGISYAIQWMMEPYSKELSQWTEPYNNSYFCIQLLFSPMYLSCNIQAINVLTKFKHNLVPFSYDHTMKKSLLNMFNTVRGTKILGSLEYFSMQSYGSSVTQLRITNVLSSLSLELPLITNGTAHFLHFHLLQRAPLKRCCNF